jgi:hypothetical protein
VCSGYCESGLRLENTSCDMRWCVSPRAARSPNDNGQDYYIWLTCGSASTGLPDHPGCPLSLSLSLSPFVTPPAAAAVPASAPVPWLRAARCACGSWLRTQPAPPTSVPSEVGDLLLLWHCCCPSSLGGRRRSQTAELWQPPALTAGRAGCWRSSCPRCHPPPTTLVPTATQPSSPALLLPVASADERSPAAAPAETPSHSDGGWASARAAERRSGAHDPHAEPGCSSAEGAAASSKPVGGALASDASTPPPPPPPPPTHTHARTHTPKQNKLAPSRTTTPASPPPAAGVRMQVDTISDRRTHKVPRGSTYMAAPQQTPWRRWITPRTGHKGVCWGVHKLRRPAVRSG